MFEFEYLENLRDFAGGDHVSFHMPGHKGRACGCADVYRYDLTELRGTDDPRNPARCGAMRHMLERIAGIYGTRATAVTTGGSSAGLMAAVLLCTRAAGKGTGGARIICGRRVHLSVINAFAHCSVDPVWLRGGMFDYDELDRAVSANPGAAAVIVTSPDYYGGMCDIPRIMEILKSSGSGGGRIPLIVDCAHGAHLDFWRGGILSPNRAGADLVVQSLHKTLPALTGAALIHSGGRYDLDSLLGALRCFVSTSPPFPIFLSAARAVSRMHRCGDDLERLHGRISSARTALAKMGFCADEPGDPFRLVIGAGGGTGGVLYDYLYKNGVICEFCDRDRVILIPSVNNTDEDFDKLINYCGKFADGSPPDRHRGRQNPRGGAIPPLPPAAMSIREAMLSPRRRVGVHEAAGCVCAEAAAPCPPGVLIAAPGEVIDGETCGYLEKNGVAEVEITC